MQDVMTCGAALGERARLQPQDTFFIHKDRLFTYREVDEQSSRVASRLTNLGLRQGDNVCALMPNSMEHVYAWFGLVKAGAVMVPVNIQLAGEQIAHIINNSEARLLIADAGCLPQLAEIQSRITGISTVIVSGDDASAPPAGWETLTFSQLLSGSPEAPVSGVRNTDLACILYTSGTTGPPKGVMLSHEYYLSGGELFASRLSAGREHVFYTTLPLYHVMGQIQGIMGPLMVGGSSLLAERFSASRYWEMARRHRATSACLTGTQCTYLFQQPPQPDDAENSLRTISAFPVPVAIAGDFEKRFGVKLRGIYGLTEALLPIMAAADAPYNMGSLGTATDYAVRIADDADNELPDYKVGNIIVRPKATSRRVFDGYYKMPAATLEMIGHCWFHTGDLGYRDADGFFYFAGRKKDVIRFRGENVSAAQVEGIVSAHPQVLECSVIGVPSEVGEEDIKVLVRLKKKGALKPEELIAYCEDKMTWFMVPRYVEFVEELPKTATDKVEKFRLKGNWKTPHTWDREAAGYRLKREQRA